MRATASTRLHAPRHASAADVLEQVLTRATYRAGELDNAELAAAEAELERAEAAFVTAYLTVQRLRLDHRLATRTGGPHR